MAEEEFPNKAPMDALEKKSGPRSWYASIGFWVLLGAVVGLGVFGWSQRQGLWRTALAGLPQARAAGGRLAESGQKLAKTAQGFAEDYLPDRPKPEHFPDQPAASTLSRPTDPSRRGARREFRISRKARRQLLEVSGGAPNAAQVQDVRQHINAPVLIDEFEVPFWQTDLGRGIKYSLCFAAFFGLLGYALFRNRDRRY